MARLILDTGVLVAAVRGKLAPSDLSESDDLAVPAIVLAEYEVGVLLDDRPGRAAAQRAFLGEVLAVVPVVDYNRNVALRHAALLAHTRATGRPRGPHDLIVAATALATDRTLVTTDERARFADLPDLAVRHLAP